MLVVVAAATLLPALAQKGGNPFAGRWDITITAGNATYPDWMEFVDKSPTPEVRIQPRGGSVRPVKDFRMEGSNLILTMAPAAGNRPAMVWELRVSGDQLSGAQKRGVTFLPGRYFEISRRDSGALRLSFAGLETDQIREGLKILGEVLAGERARAAGNREPVPAMV